MESTGDLPSLVRALRESAGLTQEALASRAGVTLATVSRVERGKSCSAGTLRRIATALGVEVEALTSAWARGAVGEGPP